MATSTTFRNELLLLLFNNDPITGIGDAMGILGSVLDGSLYVSLHTADPTAGNQATSEATYTSYARVAVARTPAGWTVTGGAVENTSSIIFPSATGGSDTITHLGIGTSASGTGKLLIVAALSAPLSVSSGITPTFAAGDASGTIT